MFKYYLIVLEVCLDWYYSKNLASKDRGAPPKLRIICFRA